MAGLVISAPAAQAGHVACGDFFGPSFAGQTVTLDSNVGPCTTRQGVFIQADNFTLDLNGFSIIGSGAIATDSVNENGVYVFGATGVTVKNGTVTKFNNGVYLDGSGPKKTNNTVTRMRLVDNIGPDATGIFGEGLQIFQGGTHTITENVVTGNGPYSGINAFTSSNNTITRNQVANNNRIDSGDHHGGGTLIMQDIGIWVINLTQNPANATNNTVTQNSVTGNGLDGVQVARFTNGNFVRTNNVVNNGFGQPAGNGFRDGSGIAVFGSFNTVEGNQASRNGGNGIAVFRAVNSSGVPVGGQSNTIRSNTAFNNGSAPNSVAFDLNDTNLTPPCDSNIWASNTFGTKNQACIS